LSITKWIHLHHGDKGITNFFKLCYERLVSGGTFIIEPQPWSSYEKSWKALKRHYSEMPQDLQSLTVRPWLDEGDLSESTIITSFQQLLLNVGLLP
jgi:7SK snRNA methylphosphate capping enzyme